MLISVLSVIQLPLANAQLTTTHLNLTTKTTDAEGVPIHTLPTDGTCRMLPNTPFWDNSSARGKLYPTDAVNNNTAYGSPFCVFLHPGVGDANKTGWSHTLDTLYGTQYAFGKDARLPYSASPTPVFPGKPLTNAQTRQVFDKYLDYSILSSSSDSVGDFQIDISVITTIYGLRIYVPPEFKWLAPTQDEAIWTDITNDYQYISVSTRNKYDPYAPGWTRVTIGLDNGEDDMLTIWPGVYHIRFFNLRAPDAAGLYFFKMRFFPIDHSTATLDIGPGNYPFVIVKSELNPAYVEVTVKTDTYPAPPYVSGQVTAEGTTPEGRAVSGVAYWGPINYIGPASGDINHSAQYMTYLFGLAAGTYTLTAQASGFNPTVTDRITLDAGQSYTKYIVIGSSPTVSVVVWSKHGTGAIPWHNLWQLPFGTNNPDAAPDDAIGLPRRDILVNLYDTSGNLINWWGSDWFANTPWRTSPAAGGLFDAFAGRGIALSPGRDTGPVTVPIPGTNQLFGFHDDGATHPTMTSYHALLVDNYDPTFLFTTNHGYTESATGVWSDTAANDPTGNPHLRGYPSTKLDGHVPWAYADYIAGMPNGAYGIESFVTGYVMDDSDSYQRAFVLGGSHYELQMDLRRSNWLETVLHLDFAALSSPGATFVVTAEDAAGSERAAVSFVAINAMVFGEADPRIDGHDITTLNAPTVSYHTGVYNGGIVIEGWNLIFPYTVGTAKDFEKDYGLNPTASTHSAGTVTLAGNPYTIKVYAADMGTPYLVDPTNPYDIHRGTGWFHVAGTPQASVFLCNTPVSLSFNLYRAKLWISLRSTDFEVPAHSRPWTFPGSDVWVSFMDSTGAVADTLQPYWYGVVQDPGVRNDTVVASHYVTLGKNAFKIPGVDYSVPAVADLNHGYGLTPYDVDNVNLPGHHEHIGVMYYGTDTTSSASINFPYVGPYNALFPGFRPTRLEPGEYTYKAWTHGYIMRRSFPVQVPFSGTADIEADLIQGGQIRINVAFLHEAIWTNFNGFVRVEVFNSAGELVGADIYGQAQPNLFTRAGQGGAYLDYVAMRDWQMGGFLYGWDASAAAGLGNATFGQFPSASAGQRAYQSACIYDVPKYIDYNLGLGDNAVSTWSGWGHMVPSDANRLFLPAGQWQAYDLYGFNWYSGGPARTWAGGWPTTDGYDNHPGDAPRDYGLSGSVDISGWSGSGAGLYTVKIWAFDPKGPDYHFETSGLSDDWRMYSMSAELKDIQLPWGGAVEYWMTMDDMAKLSGTVRWFDMYGDLRPLPWAQVTATDPALTSPAEGYPAYSTGLGAVGAGSSDSAGAFVMWLPAGSHDVSVSTSEAPGVWSSSAPTSNAQYTVVVSPGWVGGGDTQVGPSGTAVPELPPFLAAFTLLGALAASVWFLRKKTVNIPVLMK